jgi:N-acetylglucosamine-6-phosphate deacetylase
MKAYTNGKIFTGKKIIDRHIVLTENDKIIDILTEGGIPPDIEIVDLKHGLLAPAFMDIQIYGGNGHLFGEFPSVEALKATYEYCLSGGVTHFLPTVATNSEQVMYAAIEAVRAYWQQGGKGVVGLHLEGPYINVEKRGAHLKQFIVTPSVEGVKKLLAAGKSIIKMMTLAPEVCSDEVIQLIQNQGVIVSAGHTNATYQQAANAFKKGIHVATHLFNAMSPLQHREPGVVGAILDHAKVSVSAVADGYHVDFAALRIAKKILKDRLFLITDAVTESLNGQYTHRLQGDKYVIADGTLSGSALTMLKAVKNCVEHMHIPLEEALRMASLYPAKVVGLGKKLGKIEIGYDENFILLDDNINLKKVFV